MGKSRLLYEFTRSHHTHGWLLLASHSVSYGKAPPIFPFSTCSRATSRSHPRTTPAACARRSRASY